MKIGDVISHLDLISELPSGIATLKTLIVGLAIKGGLSGESNSDGGSYPNHWTLTTANRVLHSRSGNSKLIKGKLHDSPLVGTFPGYSASGQDVWLDHWEHEGTAVILSAVGARCGKAFLARGKWSAIANTHIIWIPEENFLPEYAMLILNNESFWVRSGTAQPFVKVKATLEKQIGVPPLSEQKLIVEKANHLIQLCDKLEQSRVSRGVMLTTFRKSAIDAISTAQTPKEFQAAWERIQGNWNVIAGTTEGVQHLRKLIVDLGLRGLLSSKTSDFEDRPLREIATLINGRAYKQQELLSSGTPVIRIQNLNGGNSWFYSNLDLPEDKKCVAGDLLFAWSASFGPYVWNGPESIYHYHIWKVVPNELVTRDYLYYVLQDRTEEIKSSSHGLAMLHMTKRGMEAMTIRIPSIEQQLQAVETIEKLLQICDALESQVLSKNDLAEKFSRSVALSPA